MTNLIFCILHDAYKLSEKKNPLRLITDFVCDGPDDSKCRL